MLFIDADTHWKPKQTTYSLPVFFNSENQMFSLWVWDLTWTGQSCPLHSYSACGEICHGRGGGWSGFWSLPSEHSAIIWGPAWPSLLQKMPMHRLHAQTSSMNNYIIFNILYHLWSSLPQNSDLSCYISRFNINMKMNLV